jgi:uncharacterized protein (PEP-CTERM system associated)
LSSDYFFGGTGEGVFGSSLSLGAAHRVSSRTSASAGITYTRRSFLEQEEVEHAASFRVGINRSFSQRWSASADLSQQIQDADREINAFSSTLVSLSLNYSR